mmetsp:Transcript_55395/g.177735  ORF Transcript_55395/g.177735 Transcript_55395/m.177735 type:complete len:259 (+) Transcript_55395:1648-2424(+)
MQGGCRLPLLPRVPPAEEHEEEPPHPEQALRPVRRQCLHVPRRPGGRFHGRWPGPRLHGIGRAPGARQPAPARSCGGGALPLRRAGPAGQAAADGLARGPAGPPTGAGGDLQGEAAPAAELPLFRSGAGLAARAGAEPREWSHQRPARGGAGALVARGHHQHRGDRPLRHRAGPGAPSQLQVQHRGCGLAAVRVVFRAQLGARREALPAARAQPIRASGCRELGFAPAQAAVCRRTHRLGSAVVARETQGQLFSSQDH